MKCGSCDMVSINGHGCHETGCPESWRDRRECAWCGARYSPEERGQDCCSPCCSAAYRGRECYCESCMEAVS